jgi:hypothetical protein
MRKAPPPGSDSADFRYFNDNVSPWINRGTVYGFELHEELAKPTILQFESAICALAVAENGVVLGITSGKRGHLFYFHHSFYVVDVGVLSSKPVAGGAIVKTRGDEIVGGWHGEQGGLFRHNAAHEIGTGQEDFYSRKSPIVPVALPRKGEGVLALAYHNVQRKVYGLTTAHRLFSLRDESRRVVIEAQLDSMPAPALAVLPDGNLLGAGAEGRLWQYRPGKHHVEKLDVYAPCEKGKRYVAGVQTLLAGTNGLVYGGTSTDGFFFSYDPSAGKLRNLINLGKPHRQSFIRGLTEGHDGLIYGIVDEPQGMAHLFCFDPETRGFEDLGLLSTFIPIQWTPHSLGAICTGVHGEIFLGESDTISHLFAYYPPVVKKQVLAR